MQSWFTFDLDGEECRVEKEDIHRSLASFLARLDPAFRSFDGHDPWTGGDPVIIGDVEGDRHRFRVVDADLVVLPMLAGRQVWTAEGILNTEPDHPVNLALRGKHFECGRERTGVLRVLMFEGYYRPDLGRQGQVNDQFDAVVTRTENAPAIRETAAQVFASTARLRHEAALRARRSGEESTVWTGRRDIFEDRFTKKLFAMKNPAPLAYVDGSKRRFHRPETIVEALRLKREYPKSRILAGGTSLLHGEWLEETPSLISLDSVKELNSIATSENSWEIGAAVSLTRIAETIGRECPAFPKLLRRYASRPIRNRASLGGHLVSGWGNGSLTALLMALDARVVLLSEEGERDAPLSRFFTDDGGTIMAPNEIIRSLVVPRSHPGLLESRGLSASITDAYTVAPRRSLCRPYATAAFSLEIRGRTVTKARLAYSGIGPAPFRAREAEEFLAGKPWRESTLYDVLPILNDSVEVDSDAPHAAYRKQLVVTLFQKFHFQHPDPESSLPRESTAMAEFARHDQPFFDAEAS